MQVAYIAAVDGDYVSEPHGDVGQIFGDEFLHFAAESFALFLVGFDVDLVGQCVDARVAVAAAVGALGRKPFRRKNKFENVGNVVGTYRAGVGELEIAACGVGEKRGQFEQSLTGRGIGDFTEDGGAVCTGGVGDVGGAMVKSFVGEDGERQRFFGVGGDGEMSGREHFEGREVTSGEWRVASEKNAELGNEERVLGAAAGDD